MLRTTAVQAQLEAHHIQRALQQTILYAKDDHMTIPLTAPCFFSYRSACQPRPSQRRLRGGRSLAIVLSIGLLSLGQTALATKVWNANPNQVQNNWISGMYANISGPLKATLQQCEAAAQPACEVTIEANGGVHISRTDNRQHFTLRFTGNAAAYTACHVYPTTPNIPGSKGLDGANCYNGGNANYFKLN
jgi:hypothetical protein